MALEIQANLDRNVVGRKSARWRSVVSAARQTLLPIAAACLFLLGWELVARFSGVNNVVLPAPSTVFATAFERRGVLLENAIPTTVESVTGFGLSVALGGLLGVFLTYFRIAREALYPNVILFQLIPKVAVAPLFMLWLGIEWQSRVAIGVFIAFFPIVISTVTGLNSADPNLLRLCQSLAATRRQIFFKVRLPASLPFIFNGMKISMTLAIIGVIVGEFITSQDGLGYIILFAGSLLDTPLVMAAILVLCGVGLILYGSVALCERLVMRRYGS